jgi:phosphatidylserine/phosphatidylglycerophosphate/cardiolipin synthase-like enzyme
MTYHRRDSGRSKSGGATPRARWKQTLSAGRNCWRIPASSRLSFLIDAKAYFDAVVAAMEKAERRIIIVGWDFDSRIMLRPDREGAAKLQLGTFLRNLVEARPGLEIYVLIWSSSLFYGRSGEALLPLGRIWWRHPRIKFRLDSHHPAGASHHQKIVTVDDRLAFVGGMDLTEGRWDDMRHAPENPYRRTSSGKQHDATHDVQVAFDGPAAGAITEIAMERWKYATGEELGAIGPTKDVWPADLEPAVRDHPVAIARTQPPHNDQPAIREVAALNMDMLAAASKSIYIEAQYFALPDVAEVLAQGLQVPQGPEVIIVMSGGPQGMFERYVMAENRDRMLTLLRRSDRFGRLRAFYPIWNRKPPYRIKVHSKLIIVDDRILRIGSSNLNARSLGLDTECDIALEAEHDGASEAIAVLRDMLLAEHLGTTREEVTAMQLKHRSLVLAIDELNGTAPRQLATPQLEGVKEATPMPGTELLDPRRPLSWRYVWQWLTSSD